MPASVPDLGMRGERRWLPGARGQPDRRFCRGRQEWSRLLGCRGVGLAHSGRPIYKGRGVMPPSTDPTTAGLLLANLDPASRRDRPSPRQHRPSTGVVVAWPGRGRRGWHGCCIWPNCCIWSNCCIWPSCCGQSSCCGCCEGWGRRDRSGGCDDRLGWSQCSGGWGGTGRLRCPDGCGAAGRGRAPFLARQGPSLFSHRQPPQCVCSGRWQRRPQLLRGVA